MLVDYDTIGEWLVEYPFKGAHFVVVVGYSVDKDGSVAEMIVNDPLGTNGNEGARRVVPVSVFKQAFQATPGNTIGYQALIVGDGDDVIVDDPVPEYLFETPEEGLLFADILLHEAGSPLLSENADFGEILAAIATNIKHDVEKANGRLALTFSVKA